MRLIQFHDAAQAGVIAILRQPQSLTAQGDEPLRYIQASIRFVGAIPAIPYLLAYFEPQLVHIPRSCVRLQLSLCLPRAACTAIEDWNVQIEACRRIVVLQRVIVEGKLSGGNLQLAQNCYSRRQSHLLIDRLMEIRDLSGKVLYRSSNAS